MSALVTTTQRLPIALAEQQTSGAGQYLTFGLGGEIYALGLLNIKEIIEYGHLTHVPMMPAFVRGVINLRGRVVPVVDLTARFGKGFTPIDKLTGIVIVETGIHAEDVSPQDVGIIVEAVNEVVDISQQEIEPSPHFGIGIRPDFISGMVKLNDSFIILLNLNRVLSMDEIVAISKAVVDDLEYGVR